MNKSTLTFLILIAAMLVAIHLLRTEVRHLRQERDRHAANAEALLSDIERMKIDSCTTVTTIQTLQLSANEYQKHRAADAALIEKLGIRIKDLEAAARHDVTIEGGIDAEVRDSSLVRDSILVAVQTVKMDTPHLKIDGVIEAHRLKGSIYLPVQLRQFLWIEYKHRFLWWRWKVKAVRQSISSDNPYVNIEYSEFIKLKK
ncbi:hypothetical protein DW228_18275 [Bacteroides fragilis]|uniref:Uncharacterized protein n=1 Tax=Bacteroides fragilis TaxID=817 RepID=A0A396BX18_BACFG|nr:DUF6549 family protein [Bacteroides fragilis]RHH07881.1 hypothetical protein DW228_18275 [Bacteroides fragilis]